MSVIFKGFITNKKFSTTEDFELYGNIVMITIVLWKNNSVRPSTGTVLSKKFHVNTTNLLLHHVFDYMTWFQMAAEILQNFTELQLSFQGNVTSCRFRIHPGLCTAGYICATNSPMSWPLLMSVNHWDNWPVGIWHATRGNLMRHWHDMGQDRSTA